MIWLLTQYKRRHEIGDFDGSTWHEWTSVVLQLGLVEDDSEVMYVWDCSMDDLLGWLASAVGSTLGDWLLGDCVSVGSAGLWVVKVKCLVLPMLAVHVDQIRIAGHHWRLDPCLEWVPLDLCHVDSNPIMLDPCLFYSSWDVKLLGIRLCSVHRCCFKS